MKFSKDNVSDCEEILSTQEEADTKGVREFAISAPSELYRSCTGINCRPSLTDVMLPV
jgi:hypothetical protein